MDPVILSRILFGFTIGFHYIFPQITIGLGWLIVYFLYKNYREPGAGWQRLSSFWIRIFTLCFSFGVATGIVMEFQFGMNWSMYSRFVGDVFGASLAAEGILAFFMESVFLGLLVFGKEKFSPKANLFSAIMVALGATMSGFWIIVANSWQQTPAGFAIREGRAVLVDFYQALFNPSTIQRYLHSIDGSILAGSMFVIGICAWYLLKEKHVEFARRSMKPALLLFAAASIAQLFLGHLHAVQVAETQPEKLATYEGLWVTQSRAPLLLFGIPDEELETTRFAVGVPGLLSLAVSGDAETTIKGLKEFPREERPPVLPVFISFHVMVGLGMFFIAFGLGGLLLYWRKNLFENRPFLWLSVLAIPLPILANELGWIAAEMGRQPWIVYRLMKTGEAISINVPAGHILFSIVIFGTVYLLLLGLWLFLLKTMVAKGPEE